MADPEIRRFAIEELMQAHSKSYPGRLSKAQYEMLAAFRHQVCQYAFQRVRRPGCRAHPAPVPSFAAD